MLLVRVALLLLALCAGLAGARTSRPWDAVVTHVSDGDTVWVRPARGGAQRKIRVHGIDAPELCQVDGPAARQALQRWVLHRPLRVEPLQTDDYGRLVARLWLDGQDLAALLVRAGHAWSSGARFGPGPYASEEGRARADRVGLFAHPQAERPAVFRRRHGPCRPGVNAQRKRGNGARAAPASWSIPGGARPASASDRPPMIRHHSAA
jgi:micrococcal nuclease